MPRELEYRAGKGALARIRREGFALAAVRTLVAPAAGPKWLVAAGFDRALIRERLLEGAGPRLLAGASAGAWRALALASPEPLLAHERLLSEYIGKVWSTRDSPEQIGASYRDTLQRVLPAEHAHHAAAHPTFQLAIHAAGVKGWLSANGALQKLGLAAAVAGNALAPRARGLFFEPTLFVSRGAPADWFSHSSSVRAELTPHNLHEVALASGSVPMYMAPVAITGRAAHARYLDGGLTDYHLNQRLGDAGALALLFSHERRIIPNWFDKHLPWRRASAAVTDNLLLVHPSAEFLRRLPDGQVPSREDFMRFADDPDARIRRWRAAVAQSERLGDQFLQDLTQGRVPELLQPL